MTKTDILKLDSHFDNLPIHYGKSPRDRALERVLDEAVALAAEDVADGKLNAESIGFSTGTTKRQCDWRANACCSLN